MNRLTSAQKRHARRARKRKELPNIRQEIIKLYREMIPRNEQVEFNMMFNPYQLSDYGFCDFYGDYWADHGGQIHGEIHLLKSSGARECCKCERFGCANHFYDEDPDKEQDCVDCSGNHP
jgi:hypothetical protein